MACPLTVTPVGSVPNPCVVAGIADVYKRQALTLINGKLPADTKAREGGA